MKITLNSILFLTLYFSIPALCNGQTLSLKISGRIVEKTTGHPIPYASVFIDKWRIGTASNEEGRFSLSLPGNTNNVVLTVSCLGYESAKREVPGNQIGEAIIITLNKKKCGP